MVKIYFKTKIFLLKEQGETIRNYYSNLRFALFDLSIALSSLFLNPYRACRKFLEKKGVEIVDGYGETPFSTFKQLAEAAKLSSKDHYIELGSGRGKTCVWAALFCGCQVSGYEWVPSLHALSKTLCRLLTIPAKFEPHSFFHANLSSASVVYLYSTQLSEEDLRKIPFTDLPAGSRIITISQPLPNFPILTTFPVIYPWGQTQGYIQIR